jgi:uncharacterized membrane protein
MSISCPQCAAQMPDEAVFCPSCGGTMRTPERAHGKVGVFSESIAGALAYFTFVPALVFLLLDPYKKDRFVRFHSFQCIFAWTAAFVIVALLKLLAIILFIIPFLGHLLAYLISMVVGFGFVVMGGVLVVKALQGEMFKLPVIGDLAEKQANAV